MSYLQTLSQVAKDNGLLVGPNNGGAMLKDYFGIIIDGFDFVVVESCMSDGNPLMMGVLM